MEYKVINVRTGEVLATYDAAKYRPVTPNFLGMGRVNPYGRKVTKAKRYSRKIKHKGRDNA